MTTKEKLEKVRDEAKDYHGCIGGDCPHEEYIECYEELLDHGANLFLESLAEAIDALESYVRNEEKEAVLNGYALQSSFAKETLTRIQERHGL
jgi:hypothetical protein